MAVIANVDRCFKSPKNPFESDESLRLSTPGSVLESNPISTNPFFGDGYDENDGEQEDGGEMNI